MVIGLSVFPGYMKMIMMTRMTEKGVLGKSELSDAN